MKPDDLPPLAVLTADQVDSRASHDRVPEALAALASPGVTLLGFERTVGDEIQGLTTDPATLVAATVTLTRLGGWRIGIGIGDVETPLPSSTREARGSAYIAAREAITLARKQPTDLALTLAATVGADHYRETASRDAETALMLLRSLLARRTQEGWELMDLLDADPSSRHAAATLGISPSAVSQRLSRAARVEGQRGAELATRLLGRLLLPGDTA